MSKDETLQPQDNIWGSMTKDIDLQELFADLHRLENWLENDLNRLRLYVRMMVQWLSSDGAEYRHIPIELHEILVRGYPTPKAWTHSQLEVLAQRLQEAAIEEYGDGWWSKLREKEQRDEE